MQFEEQKAYNALAYLSGGNYHPLKKYREQFSSWASAWEDASKTAPIDIDEAWNELDKNHIQLILCDDPRFPSLLREIPWPPFGLYFKGAIPSEEPSIAIVGTRKASALGKRIAHQFARELARTKIPVISGLAFGIDAEAHRGVVAERGRTIAVLANGLETVYPREHARLAAQILELDGTLISEYPAFTASLPSRFIERNRIISGLSKGVIVIEAPKKSGSLATARFAIEQNRDVFVVPGAIDNLNYRGSHELIKSGAMLITDTTDVLHGLDLASFAAEVKQKERQKELELLNAAEQTIVSTLTLQGKKLTAEQIIEHTNLSPSEIQRALAFLVIKQYIQEEHGVYSLKLI